MANDDKDCTCNDDNDSDEAERREAEMTVEVCIQWSSISKQAEDAHSIE